VAYARLDFRANSNTRTIQEQYKNNTRTIQEQYKNNTRTIRNNEDKPLGFLTGFHCYHT